MRSIYWSNNTPGWEWIVAIGFFILLFLFYLEIKKKRKRRLGIRLVLLSLLVTSLLLMASNPTLKQEQKKVSAILLTENYNSRTLDSLRSTFNVPPKIFTHEKSEDQTYGTTVIGIEQIAYQFPDVEELFIVGNSFSDFREDISYPFEIIPLLNQPPDGIAEIEFTDEVQINEAIQIQGRLRNTNDSIVSLILMAPHGKEDSISFSRGVASFSLTAYPKVSGRFLYTILEKRPGGVGDIKYNIPVVVKPFKPLNIAIFADAPSFEIRSLKNWLGEAGHHLAVRSQISSAIFRQEFINQENVTDLKISKEALDKLDVLIIEGKALSALTEYELSVLENTIFYKGLGVLVLGDENVLERMNTTRLRPFVNFEIEATNKKEQILKTIINRKNIQGEIRILPFKFKDSIEANSQFNGIYATKNLGLGKTALLLSDVTHTLNLEGKSDLYKQFWSTVLNDVLQDNSYEPAWKVPETLSFVNAETDVHLMNFSSTPNAHVLDGDSSLFALSMLQNPYLIQRWQGTFWPAKPGWHLIQLINSEEEPDAQGIEKSIYVQDNSSWSAFLQQRGLEKMKAFKNKSGAKTKEISPLHSYEAINRIYFFAIFLLSCGLLWLDEKFQK